MVSTSEISTCIQHLLSGIGHRHESFPQYDPQYWEPYHDWMLNTLGPASTWSVKKLTELEHTAGGIAERSYTCASLEMKLLLAKLTAIAILIDDSIDDQAVHDEIVQFSAKLYRGESQRNGLLALYYTHLQELSDICGGDSVLRGVAIVPWINHIDACLMEKQILTAERSKCENEDGLALRFPQYLRNKNSIAEAYAAGIFKATRDQYLPLNRYIKAFPDVAFFTEAVNDILSFHKGGDRRGNLQFGPLSHTFNLVFRSTRYWTEWRVDAIRHTEAHLR
ncbi:Terpenoid synthase [Mycena sanguinolenta]|uniref:Terpenoid synthase n=1 Tax=Mycena sanguinolenta TaxID=230812 RepID=A0A8H6U231_9AGAR|nr:Terpenoid synthase [Mycena sanguinolenta]